MQLKRQFYIDGSWVDPVRANDHEVIDPSTEEPCAVISLGSTEDTNRAVAAAKAVEADYARTSKEERAGYVRAILDQYEARKEELAQAILEAGSIPGYGVAPVEFTDEDRQGFTDEGMFSVRIENGTFVTLE